MLQAALNGDLMKAAHPAVPLSVEELVRDAVACVRVGVRGFHIHPRDSEGHERLETEVADRNARISRTLNPQTRDGSRMILPVVWPAMTSRWAVAASRRG